MNDEPVLGESKREDNQLHFLRSSAYGFTLALGVFAGFVWSFALQQTSDITHAIFTLHAQGVAKYFPDTISNAYGFNAALVQATEYSILLFVAFLVIPVVFGSRHREGSYLLTILVFANWTLLFISTLFNVLPSPTFEATVTPSNPEVSGALTQLYAFLPVASYYVNSVRILVVVTALCASIAIVKRYPHKPLAWLSGVLPLAAWILRPYLAQLPGITIESGGPYTLSLSGGIILVGDLPPNVTPFLDLELLTLTSYLLVITISGMLRHADKRWSVRVPQGILKWIKKLN